MTYSDNIIIEKNRELALYRHSVDELFAQIGNTCMAERRFLSEQESEWKQELQKRWEDVKNTEKEIANLPNVYICRKCGAGMMDNASYCMVCGHPIDWNNVYFTGDDPDHGRRICPDCGQELEEDACFCIKCGKKVAEDSFDYGQWEVGMW